MSNETIGYVPEISPQSNGVNAEMPEIRVKTEEIKITSLSPDDTFIAGLPQDLTPEEIEILDFANNR